MASNTIPKSHEKRLSYLSTFLRILRQNEGLTQKEVCEDLDLHLNTLIRAENSKNMNLLTLFKLIDHYEIDAHELFVDMKS